jgi:hypothetical protein
MSIHSPKARFRAVVNFNKPVEALGSSVTYKSDRIEHLRQLVYLCGYRDATVVIYENMAEYPAFDWKEIERYAI